jgi:hypothetical protein
MHTLLMLALLMSPDIDPPPKYKAWVQDHEVWIETSAGERRVVFDALAAEPAAMSPNGDRVVYAALNPLFDAERCGNTPQKYLVLVKGYGEFVWKIGFEQACNDFTKFEWIDDHRIGAMLCGHANCVYWIVDADSGRVLQKLGGGFDFLWSHNRKWVAHRRVSMNEDDIGSLMFNDDTIAYPPMDANTHLFPRRDVGKLTWSPDDAWVSFCETEFPGRDGFVVLVLSCVD